MAIWYADAAVPSGGTGTELDPWPIATAFSGAAGSIDPGDTVYCRGDSIVAGSQDISCDGTSWAAPITFESWPGEGGFTVEDDGWGSALVITGEYIVLKGTYADRFEVLCNPTAGERAVGGGNTLHPQSSHLRCYGLFVHEGLNSMLSSSGYSDHLFSYCTFYNAGVNELEHSQSGYAVYVQGSDKQFPGCVFFSSHPGNYGPLFHLYGESGSINSVYFDDCTMLSARMYPLVGGNGIPMTDFRMDNTWAGTIAAWGNGPTLGYDPGQSHSGVVTNNFFYKYDPTEDAGPVFTVSFVPGWTATFSGNTVYCDVGGNSDNDWVLVRPPPTSWTAANNDYYSNYDNGLYDGTDSLDLAAWQLATGQDGGSTYTNAPPPDQVSIAYDPSLDLDFCIVRISNFVAGADTVSVLDADLSAFITADQTYAIYNGQDPLGTAVATGTYNGTSIAFDMTNMQVAEPIGRGDLPNNIPNPKQIKSFFLVRTSGEPPPGGIVGHRLTWH